MVTPLLVFLTDITPQLPCGHKYCKACVIQLREKGVSKSCPVCRNPLPPGPDKLYDLAFRIHWRKSQSVFIRFGTAKSRTDGQTIPAWSFLPASEQKEVEDAVALFEEAAHQGHVDAQEFLAEIYSYGLGVDPNPARALELGTALARAGDSTWQFNIGNVKMEWPLDVAV